MINDYNKQKINDLLSAGLTIKDKQTAEKEPTSNISHSVIGENITQNYIIDSHNNHNTLWIILIVSVLGFASLFF